MAPQEVRILSKRDLVQISELSHAIRLLQVARINIPLILKVVPSSALRRPFFR